MTDPTGSMASPLTTLVRSELNTDVEAILDLARKNEVERIVVGLPRSMDGNLGPQAQIVLAFVKTLSHHTLTPVDVWDERLSTVAADRLMIDSGKKRAKRKAERDAVAAALVLQSYMDSRLPPPEPENP